MRFVGVMDGGVGFRDYDLYRLRHRHPIGVTALVHGRRGRRVEAVTVEYCVERAFHRVLWRPR